MRRARRSLEPSAALAKAGAAPGQPDGYEKNRVPRPGNGKPAARFPGGPGQGQPARRTPSPGTIGDATAAHPLDSAVRYPARRERGAQCRRSRY